MNSDGKDAVETNKAYEQLQAALAYRFCRCDLLELALTHPSRANERAQDNSNNQRLEFLGDAVLELCVSDELYRRYPDAREGPLTRMRGSLVNEASLASLARALGLPRLVRLGRGEESQGGRDKDSILADAFESVLGAIYLDGGYAAAQAAVRTLIVPLLPAKISDPKEKDPKSRLQEYCQKEFRESPGYILLGSQGPEHAKSFTVQLTLPTGQSFCATATSCKKAEQAAAAMALAAWE